MTNQQKIAYVLLLKDFMPPPLFRFLYAYVADLSDVCMSERSEGVEQYMRNPHLYDELIEEEYTKVIAKLGICFDINMFRRELMKKT